MADHNKGGFISKAQKRLTRTKTKVLQNLGKAEKTADEKFDEHVLKLERQQEVAHRFQKELRNYIHCAKAMEMASKSFYAVMLETFEQEWKGEDTLKETLQALELMWADYLQRLQDSVQEPVTTYSSHFHPLKQRIAKRNRKLDYYDNARHNSEVQQNARKKDETKIQKAADEREESRKIYEELNNELHHELPEFYNSRVNFYASTFKNFFNAENTFHAETGKLDDTAMSLSEQLAEENKQYTYQPRPLSGVIANEESVVNGHSSGDNDSTSSGNRSSVKQEKTSPKPDRPPSSPAAVMNPAARVPEMSSAPVKTNGADLSNGLSSDAESPPESPQIIDENSQAVSGKITVVTESSQPVVDNSHTIYETPKPAVEVDQKVAVEVVESSQTVVNDLQSENDKPKVEPRKSKNIGEKPQVEGEKKKGPVYENSDLNFTTPPTSSERPEVKVEKTDQEGPVDDYEEPMVNVEKINGQSADEFGKEVLENVKQTISDSTENIPPSEPPSAPPELPKDPPPEDKEELSPKSTPSKQTEEGDESDHYYDRVPDQVDPNVNQDNDDDDNFYEVPSSSKIPEVLPDGCIFVVLATHVYKNEDEDELSFEAGELIYVIPYEDPDDQDDGWLMGIKKSDGKKGVFPENFTKRV